MIQNMETASRFERAQSAAWSHLARECGGLQVAKEEIVKLNRDRLRQCVNDQMSEFSGRLKAKRGAAGPSSSDRYRWKNRKSSRSRREGAGRDRDPKRYENY